MGNLNAENEKKWLEVCAEDTPYPDQRQALLDALTLITSQEQRIKELEVELKAMRGAANAYKMHIVELSEENERILTALANYDRQTDVRIAENYYTVEAYEELREENESLHASCAELAQKCASLNEENERLITICETKIDLLKKAEAENERLMRDKTNLECIVTSARNLARADTVKKMQERLSEAFKHYPQRCGECCKEKVDQIAKEMLEDKPCT